MTTKRVKIGIIADDLTGAGDVGLFFLRWGAPRITWLKPRARAPENSRVWIIDTESRFDPGPVAGRKLAQACRLLKRWGATHIYKKVDSALRGPMGWELEALIKSWNVPELPLVLAYPEMGRTVSGGCCLIYGKAVHQTPFGKDPRNPVRNSHIPTVLSKGCRLMDRVRVLDCVSNKQMQQLAKSYQDHSVTAGSAGFAKEWVKYLPHPSLSLRERVPERGVRVRAKSEILVVSGSLHQVTWEQMEELQKKVPHALVVTAPRHMHQAKSVMRDLMRRVKNILRVKPITKFVATGGDTAMHLCRLLKIKNLTLLGAVAPGTAHMASGAFHLVTKPGGFGNKRTLVQCWDYLNRLTNHTDH